MPHWLIIDLEATTDDGGWPVTEMEVIEIGASLVNRQGRPAEAADELAPLLADPATATPARAQLSPTMRMIWRASASLVPSLAVGSCPPTAPAKGASPS